MSSRRGEAQVDADLAILVTPSALFTKLIPVLSV
jgi:hypothetical protein